MNALDLHKAEQAIKGLGYQTLLNLTFSDKEVISKAVRNAVSVAYRNETDLEAFSENGELPSLCSRLLSGDQIFFANQVERELIEYWFSVIECFLSEEFEERDDERQSDLNQYELQTLQTA